MPAKNKDWRLCDIRCHLPGLVFGEQLGPRLPGEPF
jgi:hypothetical protein